MKSMFAPVKEKPAVERLEPMSDVSPGLLLQSSPSGMMFNKRKILNLHNASLPQLDSLPFFTQIISNLKNDKFLINDLPPKYSFSK